MELNVVLTVLYSTKGVESSSGNRLTYKYSDPEISGAFGGAGTFELLPKLIIIGFVMLT